MAAPEVAMGASLAVAAPAAGERAASPVGTAAQVASPAGGVVVVVAENAAAVAAPAMLGGYRKSVEIEHRKSPSLPPHAYDTRKIARAVPHRRRTIDERPRNGKGSWTDFASGGKSAPSIAHGPP